MTARGDIYGSERLGLGYAFRRPPVHPLVLDLVADDLGLDAPLARGLDIGCGAGLSTAALSRLTRTAVGLEPNGAMLIHRARVAPGAQFAVARAEAIPFRSGSFDVLTAAGALNYVDRERFLPEAARVLVPGGTLVVYDFSSGRRIAEDHRLEMWFDAFQARWPFPRGYAFDHSRLDSPAVGLRIGRRREFVVAIPLALPAYVEYVLTETNVEQAIQAGESLEAIRDWCTRGLADIFGPGPREVLFEGYILYVHRDREVA